MGGDEVADQDEDGHEHVLSHRDDIGAGDFGNGDATVSLVGSVQVDVVRTDTGGDGDLQLLRLGQSLSGEVARVEAVGLLSVSRAERCDADVSRRDISSRPHMARLTVW